MRVPHLLSLASLALAACTVEVATIHDPLDFEPIEGQVSNAFDAFYPSRLVSDQAFFDTSAIDAAAVQRFFEATPYGKRSFLADQRLADGRSVAQALVDVAHERALNPIVLLVTLQKEAGLISRSAKPSQTRIDYAFGCGCPDGGGCSSAYRGLDKQLDCAASQLRDYVDDIQANGRSISGWGPGIGKQTLSGEAVVPANVATAALYTYTPWILRGSGGNWLFWNVWRRYSIALDYQLGMTFPFNEGFIGGACGGDEDCFYSGGVCRQGVCSLPCTSTCPDRAGGFATTFCAGTTPSSGYCVAQCDTSLTESGCDIGQSCQPAARPGDPGTVRDVCVP